MKRFSWETRFGLSLTALSALLYLIHYLIFRDLRHIFIWSTTNVAFLPISVLFVTLIINRLLSGRERRVRLEKLNMLIGTFFSKVGTTLLRYFSRWDPQLDSIRAHLKVTNDWSDLEFLTVSPNLCLD